MRHTAECEQWGSLTSSLLLENCRQAVFKKRLCSNKSARLVWTQAFSCSIYSLIKMTTGVIYARVSSIGDRQSTERQIKDLSEYAKYKGIEVRKVFEEHISGAKKNDERPVLCEAMEYCKANRIGILLVSELSRLGRNAFEVLASVKELIDCGINLYIQKEQLTLLDEEGHPSLFAPIMIATLSTCAQLERDNISFRLQSGRKRYIEKGGKLGRKIGSVKTEEQMKAEYREVISLLRKGYSIRDVAKLSGKGVSTVQRVKRLIKV